MLTYQKFVKNLALYYLFGSFIAVIGVGVVLIPTTLALEPRDLLPLAIIVFSSILCMMGVEWFFFKRHAKPIKNVCMAEAPSYEELKTAYYQAHQFPKLTGYRILGPHLFGLSIPAVILTIFFIRIELVHIPYAYILYGIVCAVLIAGMHAMIEYYHTSTAIIPILEHIQKKSNHLYQKKLTLEGKKIISLKTKFQLSALLFGAFPLLLFSLATQMRLSQGEALLIEVYWVWSLLVLLVGCGLSLYGARLLFSIVAEPLNHLHDKMKKVQEGNFDVRAAEYYSDEFSQTINGFNHMVKGLKTREVINNQLYESFFETLATTLDARDSYTAGHSVRVAEYAVEIGKKAGLTKEQLQTLRKTGLLHDIGKIGVPDDVLLKDGRLTEEEFKAIQLHPVLGEEILRTIQPADLMEKLIPGVRSHHERIDGGGYPDRLMGDQIPLFGKILAVADAFDAMTSDRPYRLGMSQKKALQILKEGSGTQWDPQFVKYFIEWCNENNQANHEHKEKPAAML
ncbi:HD domain-containing protein [Alkalihalophilus pseudofirmus]|uniref:HD-GYP domain-containing protein n=1 Tax=Alkalihalophilus pseudofirmus TaxID=79885 RepID=UPI00259BEF87|nr:HD domain-containing phosphohydrolase [Alkalihalophilus pseudofirmus]WEG15473.1 HD domain-containing protein [Alkalihalophilus pseudofirmus]